MIVAFLKGHNMDGEKESRILFVNLLFPKIFKTFRMAIQPSKLIIAFLAIAVICLAGWIMDFSQTVVVGPQTQIISNEQITTKAETTELQIYLTSPAQMQSYLERYKQKGQRTGVFSTLWHFAALKFHGALKSLFAFNLPGVAANVADYFRAMRWALRYHWFYCIVFFVIKLAVISIAGGAICRLAALQFARGEKPGLSETLRFSIKKFVSLFTAPLAPMAIIIFLGLFIFILGLIGNIPWIGELIIGITLPLALITGSLVTVVLIGAVAGFNLMYPVIVYEGSDCFDAISRSFSYVYSKPWRMVFYTVIAGLYGAICYIFVRFFVFLLLLTTHLFLRLGVWADNSSKQLNKLAAIWPEPSFMNLPGTQGFVTTNWSESVAVFLVYLSLLVVVGLVVSFIISFYFSANTVIYSLMRNKVDGTDLEEIYNPFAELTSQSREETQTSENAGTNPENS